MLPYLGDTPAERARHLEQITDEPAITGAQVRYVWAQLEPRKGEYDFGPIERDLALLAAHHKRLVIQIMDRAFGAKSPDHIVPEYMMSEPQFGGALVRMRNGYAARLWEQPVMDREIALFQALGRRFDSEAYVEGIMGEETSIGLADRGGSGFDPKALGGQLERWLTAVRAAWPHTNVFMYTNFLHGDLPQLIAECAKEHCGAGGPDVLPSKPTEGVKVLLGEAGGRDYRGGLPIAFAIQAPELGGSQGTFTPQQLFDYAYGTLHANYLFWMRNTASGGPEQQWDTGILPFIRSIDGKINAQCPANLRCDTGDAGAAR